MTWQEAVKKAIDTIPFAEYDRTGGQQGVSEDILWNGTRVLEAGDPPKSFCSGAVGEVILKAFKYLDLEKLIPIEDIYTLIEYGFVYDINQHFDGYSGGLIDLEIADWIDEEDVEYGDIAQYWHEDDDENRRLGHVVIITGVGKYKGKDVFKDWSATNLASINGHGYDWHLVDKELRSGHSRIWYIARPDIESIKQKYTKENN